MRRQCFFLPFQIEGAPPSRQRDLHLLQVHQANHVLERRIISFQSAFYFVTAASNDFNFKRWSMMKNIKKFAKACFCVSPLTVNMGNDHLIEFHLTESVDRIFRSNA